MLYASNSGRMAPCTPESKMPTWYSSNDGSLGGVTDGNITKTLKRGTLATVGSLGLRVERVCRLPETAARMW